MNKKIWVLLAIIFQLSAIFWLIYRHKKIEMYGTEFKFKCSVVDPNNPLLGKYIDLNFANSCAPSDIGKDHEGPAFIFFENDSNGYARVSRLTGHDPGGKGNYIQTEGLYLSDTFGCGSGMTRYYLPFRRFYMNEKLAPEAEKIYRQKVLDSASVVYASVFVYHGKYLLKDVLVNGVSIGKLSRH